MFERQPKSESLRDMRQRLLALEESVREAKRYGNEDPEYITELETEAAALQKTINQRTTPHVTTRYNDEPQPDPTPKPKSKAVGFAALATMKKTLSDSAQE